MRCLSKWGHVPIHVNMMVANRQSGVEPLNGLLQRDKCGITKMWRNNQLSMAAAWRRADTSLDIRQLETAK